MAAWCVLDTPLITELTVSESLLYKLRSHDTTTDMVLSARMFVTQRCNTSNTIRIAE